MVQMNQPGERNSLTLLSRYGDPMEQRILRRREELAGVVEAYADIWAQFVLPRRSKLQSLESEDAWVRFAGSHYTALITVNLALDKLQRLMELCELLSDTPDNADLVLELHDVTEGFWHHTDQAARHLLYAIEEAPSSVQIHGVQRLKKRWLRSSPGTVRDTLLVFYQRVPRMIRKKLYRTHYPRSWQSFLGDIQFTWRSLHQKLVTHAQPLASLEVPLPFPIKRAPAPPMGTLGSR